MKSIDLKWTFLSFVSCLCLMGIVQIYLYQGTFSLTNLINDAFIAGLITFCFGGLFYIIQSGFFDVPVNAIRNFWRFVSKLGQWIRENEIESDRPLFDPEVRKRRHPLAFSSALVGLLFCIISLLLSYL